MSSAVSAMQRAEPARRDQTPRALTLEIFAISLATIVLEISYTRIFSFKVYYYFTYLIIAIALLGLGAGGVFVAVLPRLRSMRLTRLIPGCGLLAALVVLAGYFVIARTQLNPSDLHHSVAEVAKLALVSFSLFVPFLLAGVVLASVFGARPSEIGRLYGADLLGAGLGCAATVPLISVLTPPGCVMLSGLLFATTGLRLALRDFRALLPAGAVVAAALLVGALFPAQLPDPVPERQKTLGSYDPRVTPIVFSRWSPVFRVDVMDHPHLGGVSYLVIHDGQMGSGLWRFDGDLSALRGFDGDTRSFPFSVLKPAPKVLIIGAAGGHEILASLYFGASHVTAVELNPVTVSLLTTHFAEYTGHLAEHPRVELVNAEGRSFLKRDDTKYDLIWFVAPDTYATMNAASSAAYVLSEGYLFTVEMIVESLQHLEPGGIICTQFGEPFFDEKPNRTLRYLSTAREALRRRDARDFAPHALVATTPDLLSLSTILLKATPFAEDEIARFVRRAQVVPGTQLRWVPGRTADDGPVTRAITLPGPALERWYGSHPYLVTPVTDDSPFFWHFARFRDAMRSAKSRGVRLDPEDSTGERLLLLLLAFVSVFATVFLLLPFVLVGSSWRVIPAKAQVAAYFAALGLGFMCFEVSLIQMLTLFLGYPSYSLSVTLFGLLLSTAAGSWLSARYHRRGTAAIGLFACLALVVLFYQFGWPALVERFIGAALPLRVALAILVIAPLGMCLGAFMPLGLGAIAETSAQPAVFVAWAWAINGFFSVISSILATIIAMTVGFTTLLLGALVLYLIAVVVLTALLRAAPGTRWNPMREVE